MVNSIILHVAPSLNNEMNLIRVQYPWVIKLLVAAIAKVVTLVLVQPFRCQLVAVDEQFRKRNIKKTYSLSIVVVATCSRAPGTGCIVGGKLFCPPRTPG